MYAVFLSFACLHICFTFTGEKLGENVKLLHTMAGKAGKSEMMYIGLWGMLIRFLLYLMDNVLIYNKIVVVFSSD